MCVAIPRRRTLLAAYSEEHRRPLIAQFPVHGGIVTETRIQSAYNVGSLTQSRPDVSELRRSASAYSSACITRARGRAKWCAADPGPPKLKQRRSELCKIPGLQRIMSSAFRMCADGIDRRCAAHAALRPGHARATACVE